MFGHVPSTRSVMAPTSETIARLIRLPCQGTPPNMDGHRTTMSSMPQVLRQLAAGAGSLVVGVLVSGCSSSKPSPVPPHASELWGDLTSVVSVKELMKYMIDPVADNIFNAVGTEVTRNGVVEREPKTDE